MNAGQPLTIHPAAEAYRLMTEEELASLAADITEKGQHDPIVIGRINGHAAEQLIDGRNRLRACEIAGVKPHFETRDFASDDDVIAFVKSRSERRDLSKGERAMGMALLYPEPEKGGRGNKVKALETSGFSRQRLGQARQVLRFSPEMALAVRDGKMKLDEALAKVKDAQQAVQSEETMITRLQAEAPDLADLVAEDRMKAREAIAALDARIEDMRRKEITATSLVATLVNGWHPRGSDPAEYCARLTMNAKSKHWRPDDIPLTRETLRAVAAVVAALEDQLERWES